MKKIIAVSVLGLLVSFAASAHVVVKPAEVGVGAFQTFTMGVPSEKEVPTTSLRLVLPDGLNFVTPNVKPGWKVEVKKQATGKKITDDDGMEVDELKPMEIIWTGGSVPSEQRDEFSFSAQVPPTERTLQWKAYQTYQDGSVIAWENSTDSQPKNPDGTPDYSKSGPFSTTKVINDLTAAPAAAPVDKNAGARANTAVALSIAALVLSAVKMRPKKA